MQHIEDPQAASLLDAQHKANALFTEIEQTLLRPGITESALSNEIHQLAATRFGVVTHWHKRVVRAGANTLCPYNEDPPDHVIQPDDILFLDLGPVFESWEADFGRTYVLGNDPEKHRLRADLEPTFRAARAHYAANPQITAESLYATACALAEQAGWIFGGTIAGHLVGEYPHARIPGDKTLSYITTGNPTPINSHDESGRKRHWILEIHLVDQARKFGGFYEELLTV
jgi:Xaa-Pro aminopeptidase